MKIIILSQWCHPEPDLKALPFAEELKRQGQEVEILTGFPNYPGGKVYGGYSIRPWKREIINGIKVNRVALFPSHSKSKIGRILNYLSFALSAAILGPWLTGKADIIYAYHPPATVAIPALVLKFFKRAKVVYDIQDFWPDTLAATGMLNNPKILKVISVYMQYAYRYVDRITVLSPGFKKKLIGLGVPDNKVTVVYNWSLPILSPAIDRTAQRNAIGVHGEFMILYAGNIGPAQNLLPLISSFKEIPSEKARLVLIGDGVSKQELIEYCNKNKLKNIQFLDRVPSQEIGKFLISADALLVHLKKDPLFTITIPSKIQAYLSVGVPLIAGVEGDAAQLILQADAGVIFEPENPDSFINAVKQLLTFSPGRLNEMGQRGFDFYQTNLNIKPGTQRFIEIFQQV